MSCPFNFKCDGCKWLWPFNQKHSYDACQLGFRLQQFTHFYYGETHVKKESYYKADVKSRNGNCKKHGSKTTCY